MGVWHWPMAMFTDSDSGTQAIGILGVMCAPLSWQIAFCAPNMLVETRQ